MTDFAQITALLSDPALQRLFALARQAGGAVRVTGGAVRDALLGRKVGDCDLASTLPPDVFAAFLASQGIKVVPIGIDHGTIMAVVGGKPFEITTLRRDIKTDGRHATVAFTDDWEADAARRDFTINALYLDEGGVLYDPQGGVADLKAKRLRFIGRAAERLAEDYLRALRYFRFLAQLGWAADAEALSATAACTEGLVRISGERVWREVKKLLATPAPSVAWRAMTEAGLVSVTVPGAYNVAALEKVEQAEALYGAPSDELRPYLRLVALGGGGQNLPLSRDEKKTLAALTMPPEKRAALISDPSQMRSALYHRGGAVVRGLVLLAGDAGDKKPALDQCDAWHATRFPLSGADLLQMGIIMGPELGTVLAEVEEWWIAASFPDRAACLEKAKSILSQNGTV